MALTCRDALEKNTITLKPDDPVSKAFELIKIRGIRFLPVIADDGTYVGVFTSSTLARLLLPQALTINIGSGGMETVGLNNLAFYNLSKEDFHQSLAAVKDEKLKDHLSNPDNIPVVDADCSLMDGILTIYQYKRHAIVIEPGTNKFAGLLSVNAIMESIFSGL